MLAIIGAVAALVLIVTIAVTCKRRKRQEGDENKYVTPMSHNPLYRATPAMPFGQPDRNPGGDHNYVAGAER